MSIFATLVKCVLGSTTSRQHWTRGIRVETCSDNIHQLWWLDVHFSSVPCHAKHFYKSKFFIVCKVKYDLRFAFFTSSWSLDSEIHHCWHLVWFHSKMINSRVNYILICCVLVSCSWTCELQRFSRPL